MQYEIKIDPQLWKVDSEIRLGVMQFTAAAQPIKHSAAIRDDIAYRLKY